MNFRNENEFKIEVFLKIKNLNSHKILTLHPTKDSRQKEIYEFATVFENQKEKKI